MPAARKSKSVEVKNLYYITHIDNIASMLTRGILSHAAVASGNVPFTTIYDHTIVGNRQHKLTPANKGLWDYANVYFQPRNPMMYRAV